jgi:hypothetical protein
MKMVNIMTIWLQTLAENQMELENNDRKARERDQNFLSFPLSFALAEKYTTSASTQTLPKEKEGRNRMTKKIFFSFMLAVYFAEEKAESVREKLENGKL